MFRPPSIAWEPLRLAAGVEGPAWVWFFPAGAPGAIQVHLPAETAAAAGVHLTVEALLASVGLPPAALQGWDVHGGRYEIDAGALSLVGHPLPTVAGQPLDVNLRLRLPAAPPSPPAAAPGGHPPTMAFPPSAAVASSAVGGGAQDSAALLDSLAADWLAILQVERHLDAMRKQLSGLQGRLQSLNRDLSPEERLHSDNNDRKDWTDARRWLRDAAAQLARYIREYDIGSVSSAGGRNRFDDLYRDYIEPRRPFDGMAAAQLEFEQYRKTHQALLSQMQAVQSNAQRDGEQRAQQLLARINAKVRTARTKR